MKIRILAFIGSLIVLIQSFRTVPLIDYSYQTENAYRIFQGETPYRYFFLVLTPGTYYLMAGLIGITNGYNHLVQVMANMTIAFLTIITAHRLFLELNANKQCKEKH